MVDSVTAAPRERAPAGLTRRLSSVGLVLAGIMSLFNAFNGVSSLIDPMFALDAGDPPQPRWMSAMLLAFGAVTLAALVSAWRGRVAAILTVAISRVLEGWSALMLPFLPDAPDGLWPFVVALVVGGTVVGGLVALRLRH